MAGLGEACSHIGAVLFYIEVVVKKRDELGCTDKDNAWLPPKVRFLQGKEASQVSFSSARMKKRIMDGERPLRKNQSRASAERPTDEEWSKFLSACHQSASRPALLCLEQEYAKDFAPVATKFADAILSNMQQQQMPGSWSAVSHECLHLTQDLSIEQKVAETIEMETRQQASCKKWFAFRAGRVTASNAKQVCRTSPTNPSRSLIRKICYPENTRFWLPQTAWRQQHEREAYISVSQDIHMNVQCAASGLHISVDHPFLAATPDVLVNCTCCGRGVVELKCPYNGRQQTVRELAKDTSACFSTVGGALTLKKDHSYYYQVQMHMLVCKVKYCDFVLWTLKDLIIIRVYKDTEFCDTMLKRYALYFKLVLLPEMCFHYWTEKHGEVTSEPAQNSEDEAAEEEVYCMCRGPESGKMVMCDSETCRCVWFHYKCVNLRRAPRAKWWYCPECTRLGSKA